MGDFVISLTKCPSRTCSSSRPCLNEAVCTDIDQPINGVNYMCSCSMNYFGVSCQFFNACSIDPCGSNGDCMANINSVIINQYTCVCHPGYTGIHCDIPVIPVCVVDSCANGGTCSVTGEGTLVCACPSGFTGDACETPLN